ncbi:MAG: TonB-dependent receptor, partial [Acetobacteraceae bacterium]
MGKGNTCMKPSRPLRLLVLSLACSAALAAQAQTAPRVEIPAGDLAGALDAYARQTGTQLVYRADQLQGARSAGLDGQTASPQALDALLKGSGFRAQRDASGAVVIVPAAASTPAAAPVRRPTQAQPPQGQAANAGPVTDLGTVQVTGSRIPRAQVEGPAPITVVTAEQIKASGLTSVPEVLRSLSQNSGSVQGQQNTTSAQST